MDKSATIIKPIKIDFEKFQKIYTTEFQSGNPLLSAVYNHLLASKGKQIRPILTLLSAKLFGQITETTYRIAMGLEMLHAASLIHDDVVDETLVRRGNESVNSAFSNKIAVLCGDYILSRVLSIAGELNDNRYIKAFASLGESLSDGELLQIINAKELSFSEEKYFEVIEKKTAVLFQTCLYLGALSSGTSYNKKVEDIKLFGFYLGICFQIKDDIFDYFDSKKIGKPTANDIREKKVTLPLLYALSKADKQEFGEIKKLFQQTQLSQEDIQYLISFAKNKGGIQYAEKLMVEYKEKAIALLQSFDNEEIKQSLIGVLEYSIDRGK
jgi:octaprenyl-diphosphate synthase